MLERSNRSVGERAQRARWPWLIVVVVVGMLKVEAYASLVRHPVGLIVVLAGALVFTLVLRPRPVAIAAMAAALFALALAPHPFVFGAGVGVGAFVVLMVAFFALASVLHARQGRS